MVLRRLLGPRLRLRHLPLVLVLGLLVLLATATTPALGDGDPASDVLLGENVFFPYAPPVSRDLQRTLQAETAAAVRAGLPLKVALIASPVDLGVVPDLFGQPQKYAAFLDQEISFQNRRQPLLVVMASGYGSIGLTPAASAAVAALPRPPGGSVNDLARAAITAVARTARASGHPLPSGVTDAGGGGSDTLLLIGLVVAALLIAAWLGSVTLRRKRYAGGVPPPR